jgi:23S rRNA (uridine2552-2'-O)-methyltransferase
MAKSKSSQRWLKEHFDDEFVKKSQQDGYRSRAVYKLQEIQKKDNILRPGMAIVDLGAAPGGWSQYAVEVMKGNGRVFAMDLLEIEPLDNVEFIQGDFSDDEVYQKLMKLIDGKGIDLVVSDISPNISGVKSVDQPKVLYLAELAYDFSVQVLKPGGMFLTKVFQGEGVDQFYRELRKKFKTVLTRKPKASRSRSAEVYILAKGYKV